MSIPLKVTAMLDSIAVTPSTGMFGLDAPLSWGWIERAREAGDRLPPLTETYAPDLPLPLAKYGTGPEWVWCTSRAHWDVVQHVTVATRRRPATSAMARYGKDRKHHMGLGPYKARDVATAGVAARSVSWDVLCEDAAELEDLLAYVTHLGPRHRNGHGHVTEWRITGSTPDRWKDRPMPHPDGEPTAIRSPYWHHTRQAPCVG